MSDDSPLPPEVQTNDRDSNPLKTKLKTLKSLGKVSTEARAARKSVVLCHGTFDLLHIGHLRHLRAAKGENDILIVTITGDAFVNKGPGRPIFSEMMRAEALATQEVVDYVGIAYAPKALEAITEIKPSIYAKGSDYRDPDDDVTGGIVQERNAVEAAGGRMVFTEDVVFSSSTLINRHMSVFDPQLDGFLETQRERDVLKGLTDLLDKAQDMNVLVIGDAIIDEYQYVTALGKSQKEMMIATLKQNIDVFAGGVFAAANHVADFCKSVDVVSVIKKDCRYAETIHSSLRPNVTLFAFEQDAPTTCKTRFVDKAYLRKLFEVYEMDDTPIDDDMYAGIRDVIASRIQDYDAVIVTDFGHGLLTPDFVKFLEANAPFLAVNTQSNSANMGFNLITKYNRCDFFVIDAPEARLAVGDKRSEITDIVQTSLPDRIDCPHFFVTHGKFGCVGYRAGQEPIQIPAFTKTVVDTVGAGDAFFVVTSLFAAAGGTTDQLGFIGNAAGAIKVGILGHRNSVERIPLIKFLTTLLK